MKPKRVYVLATNSTTQDQSVCYLGDSVTEAKLTVRVLRREDKETGNFGLWNYVIKRQKEDGTLERWFGKNE